MNVWPDRKIIFQRSSVVLWFVRRCVWWRMHIWLLRNYDRKTTILVWAINHWEKVLFSHLCNVFFLRVTWFSFSLNSIPLNLSPLIFLVNYTKSLFQMGLSFTLRFWELLLRFSPFWLRCCCGSRPTTSRRLKTFSSGGILSG